MSIAVSALIRPSPLLRLLTALLAALCATSAVCLFLFTFRFLPTVGRLVLCLPVGLIALGLLYSAFRARKSFLLDISGLGLIRLREHYTGAAQTWRKETPVSLTPGKTVRLLDGSTLWPCLLSLQFEYEDGGQTSLLVLPDSVAPGALRALSLSLRCIAARDSARDPRQL
jgi:hypothetical protein